MRQSHRFVLLSAALAAMFVHLGCRQQSPAPSVSEAPATNATAPTETEVAPADANSTDVKPAAEETAATDPPLPAEEPATPVAPQEDEPMEESTNSPDGAAENLPAEKVMLGDPSLTAGIPGEGKLTIEQIKAWLDDPKNHAPLAVELPLGLSAGAALISGLEENPMTRAKIELGRQLYFDPLLSADSTISCASCHDPDQGYTAHTQFGVGIQGQLGGRNSPVAFNRILSKEQFWDGRALSLEDQAIGPIANPIEMGHTHEACEVCVDGVEAYKLQFAKIFPDGVTIKNIGKAIATFERAIVTGASPYDYYEPLRTFEERYKGDPEGLELLEEEDPDTYEIYQKLLADAAKHPMSDSAKRGREIFFTEKGSCTACHAGANFTDEKYHNLGVGMEQEKPDIGRAEISKDAKDTGAFKTPTCRNVALTAPYMHDGSQKTLEEVVEWYVKGGHPNPHLSDKVKKLNLTDQDKADLVEFMKALTGPLPAVQKGRLPE